MLDYQAEGCGEEDVGTMAEDVGEETDIEERKDQFLRTVERLLKPSERKRRHRRRKEKRTGVEKVRCRRDEMARNR